MSVIGHQEHISAANYLSQTNNDLMKTILFSILVVFFTLGCCGSEIQAKTSSFAWYYAHLALPLASPKVLSL